MDNEQIASEAVSGLEWVARFLSELEGKSRDETNLKVAVGNASAKARDLATGVRAAYAEDKRTTQGIERRRETT